MLRGDPRSRFLYGAWHSLALAHGDTRESLDFLTFNDRALVRTKLFEVSNYTYFIPDILSALHSSARCTGTDGSVSIGKIGKLPVFIQVVD